MLERNEMMREEPLVSICCITYNHEPYIRDAIEGFLMQETDFPFEIIIHDDASTDKTAEIIKEYERKYPEIIKPIYQTENQYSKGRMIYTITYERAKGKYIARCEGDDYWTDSQKLKIQIEEMRKRPECYISFHPATMIYEDKSNPNEVFGKRSFQNKIFSTRQVILGGGGFMPSASLCLKREFIEMILNSQESFYATYLNDYFTQVFSSLNGGAIYINKTMSVYRYMSKGSWSERVTNNEEYCLLWIDKSIQAVEEANILTERKFSKEFDLIKQKRYGYVLRNRNLSISVKTEYFNKHKKIIGWKNKILWFFVYKNKMLMDFLRIMKRLLRKMRCLKSRNK